MCRAKIAEQLEIDAKYAVYLDRQTADIESYRKDESFELPEQLDYAALPGLSNEIRQKLQAHKPRTIGQAGRIDGITPAALTLLVAHVRRSSKAAPQPDRGLIPCPKPRTRNGQPSSWPMIERSRRHSSPVSRETLARLDRLVEILLPVAAHTNLIARSTIPQLWTRHIADSLQLLALAPDARTWIDLGSGAGFPGLVIACALADQPGSTVHLVESVQKKAAFLREAAQQIQVPATVHAVRIEDFGKNPNFKADVVTARALAPLDQLLTLAHPLLRIGCTGSVSQGTRCRG